VLLEHGRVYPTGVSVDEIDELALDTAAAIDNLSLHRRHHDSRKRGRSHMKETGICALSHEYPQKHPWALAPSPADEIAAMHRKAGQFAAARISNQRDHMTAIGRDLSVNVTQSRVRG